MGLKDSRTPMPQQSWSIIQRPRAVWWLSKTAGGGEGLIDLFAVVGAGGGDDGGVVADESDVGAFAGHEGFADVVAHVAGRVEVGFEEELVVGVELPEDGEDALVGEEHLPDGLDPADGGVGGEGVGAELLL